MPAKKSSIRTQTEFNFEHQRLARRLSPLNVWALALGCVIGSGAFILPGDSFLIKGGTLGMAIAMGLAALIMVIIAFNYSYMVNRYPLSGGEFTYTKAAFGKTHSFLCAWFLGLSYLSLVPLNATGLAVVSGNLFKIFQVGFHYKVAGFEIFFGEIVLAIAAILFFAWLCIRGVKSTGVFQTILVFALITGILIVLAAAIFSPKAALSNLLPAYYPGKKPAGSVLSILAVAPFALVGFDTVPQAAEEFHFSPRKAKAIMAIAIVFGAGVYIILNSITAVVIPEGYATWVEYINDVPNLTGLKSLPTFHAAYSLLGLFGLVWIYISVLAAILSGILGFYMATSRLLFSMAREKVIPSIFGKLHTKYKTPVYSILFVMVISLIAPFFGRTVLGWIVDMSSLGAAIGYGYTSAAAFKMARSEGNTGTMITGAVGVIMAVMFTVLLLVPIPSLGCSLGKESYICLIVWTVLGLVFYKATSGKNRGSDKS